MVIVSRDTGQSIVIGTDVRVTVLEIGQGRVRMAIEAPGDVEVHREEIYARIAGRPVQSGGGQNP